MWARLVCVLIGAVVAGCVAAEFADSSTVDPMPPTGADASAVPPTGGDAPAVPPSTVHLLQLDSDPRPCHVCCSDAKVDEMAQLLTAVLERLRAQESILDALWTTTDAVAMACTRNPDPNDYY